MADTISDPLLARLHHTVPMRTPRALSRTILEMVAAGELVEGARMPTVRAVAAALNMSVASVAAAWRELVDLRVLDTRRRGGTRVLGPPIAPRAPRFATMMQASAGIPLNLGHLTSDPALLPPLEPALVAAARSPEVNQHAPVPISRALQAAVAPGWPFAAPFFLATHGGIDAAELALRGAVRPGDRVLVESPGISRILDIIQAIGATPVPIAYGPQGPDLDQLRRALRNRPAAFVYQPTGNTPNGHSVTADWIDRAAALIADARLPVIEMTQAPLLHPRPWLSLGALLPDMVVHVHAYTFFFGWDLRIGVVGGGERLVDGMWQQLTYSSRWVSRILQDALAHQLTDSTALEHLDRFVGICHTRHRAMTTALIDAGFDLHHHGGPSIWLPVADEHVASARMSRRGIVVHPGSYFSPERTSQHHVLVNGTVLGAGHEEVAALLAGAADET